MIRPEGWITTDDGVKLYYSSIGTGAQVVVVPCGFYFEDDFERLSDGRTLVLLHQRGRGRSEVPDGAPVDIPHEAADLEVVRRALASTVGRSSGGRISVWSRRYTRSSIPMPSTGSSISVRSARITRATQTR